MGNSTPLCQQQPQRAQEIEKQISRACTLEKQIKGELKTKVVQIAKSPLRIQFFYIQPLLKDEITVMEEDIDQELQTKQKKVPSELTDSIKPKQMLNSKNKSDSSPLDRILVDWNSFIKVKKKNYLEDYVFIKEIGRGAYGTISKIRMKYGGLFRAAKTIKSSAIMKQKQNEKKLFAQVAIPMKLDHPNINKLYQVFEWKQQFVLVNELCQGGDLFQIIKNNKTFSEKQVADIMKQILSGVVYMHKQNIIHRDLKPENILYDNDSKMLKIIDFGTAVEFKENQQQHSLVGTPYYIAPDVIKGCYDEKCDVWSCGVILYILLSGIPPFGGKNEKEIMGNVVNKEVQFSHPIWNKRSRHCKSLITSMLYKDPKKRISAYDALLSSWMTNTPAQQANEIGNDIVSNLKTFRFQNKLKAVVYTYIASQLYSNKDKQILLKAFREIDKDGDGVLDKNEIVKVFNLFSSSKLSQHQIEQVISLIDTNGSGLIDFTEFLVAASNQQQLLEQKRLENAFSYLDTDHSGYISIDQIREFLDGSDETADQIRMIFKQVDQNGDGVISKKEFMHLLLKKQ